MTLQWNFSNCTAVFPLGFYGNRPLCDHAWLCLLYFSNNFWSCWAVSPKSISNTIKLFHENRQLCRAERSCKCPKGCNMNLPLIKQWFTWLRDHINVLVIRKVSITAHYQPHCKSVGNQGSSVHFPLELLLFQRWNRHVQKGRREENIEKLLTSVFCKSFTCFAGGVLVWSAKLCVWVASQKWAQRINKSKTPHIWKHEMHWYRQLKMGGELERYLDWNVLRYFHWWDRGYAMVSFSKDHHECPVVTKEQGLWFGQEEAKAFGKRARESVGLSLCLSLCRPTFSICLGF